MSELESKMSSKESLKTILEAVESIGGKVNTGAGSLNMEQIDRLPDEQAEGLAKKLGRALTIAEAATNIDSSK